MLDTFTNFPGKTSLEAAATVELKLLQTRLSDSFRRQHCVHLTSTAAAGSQPLYREARPHAQYCYWLPHAKMSVVHIIRVVALLTKLLSLPPSPPPIALDIYLLVSQLATITSLLASPSLQSQRSAPGCSDL